MTNTPRISESAAKTLRVMGAMKGHSITGLSNGELAKALSLSASTVNRCLNTLIAEGYAWQMDNGRYALSIQMLKVAQAHAAEVSRAQARLDELNQRVGTAAHQ